MKCSTKLTPNIEIVIYSTLVLINMLPLLKILLSKGPIYTKTLNKSSASYIALIVLHTK